MSSDVKGKTFGQAIDEIVAALQGLDPASRAVAVRAACEKVEVEVPAAASPDQRTPEPVVPAPQPGDRSAALAPPAPLPGTRVIDIRTLRAEKQPTSAVEMAAVVAHYLETVAPESERKATVATADLNKYFRQADFPLRKRLEQVLVDAKAAGYFDSAGRGAYKLNPVGYNLVVHTLPRGTSAGSARKAKVSSPRRARASKGQRRG